ncbi:MAG: STAS domain-containing protein [Clostridia bacterium]|nr:STAS domain-containing protein [Clostridia bacterium]
MPLTIKIDKKIITAYVSGEIDHHSAAALRNKIDTAVINLLPEVLYLDFSEITFMDSSGIGLIMGRYKLMKAQGGKLRVINSPPVIERMIKLAGISKLDIWEDEYEKIS